MNTGSKNSPDQHSFEQVNDSATRPLVARSHHSLPFLQFFGLALRAD
jgi:hypothetical protein